MVAKATAGKVPLSAAVFLLSNKIESRGSIKWSILQAELIGLVGDKDSYDTIQDLRGKVRTVVSGDASLDDSSYIDTSASSDTKEEAEDEIPF